ncbi:hypothetical protein KCU90_g1775, partial [Aureobasidium melanogenum]
MGAQHDARQADRDARGQAEHDAKQAHGGPRRQQHQEQRDRIDGGRQHGMTADAGEIQFAYADTPAEKGQLGHRHNADGRAKQQRPADSHAPRVADCQPKRDGERERQRHAGAAEAGDRVPQVDR